MDTEYWGQRKAFSRR